MMEGILSAQVETYIEKSSWIRKMFESGIELKQKYGQDKVYDFSLGNPDLSPPQAVADALEELSREASLPMAFGYMPNAGYPLLREKLAAGLAEEQKVDLKADNVLVTCGAAGGLNDIFRAVLEPGDEVLCPAPYFVEYGFYVQNHQGVLCPVASKPLSFELDLKAIEAALTEKTRVVLINSPNNPTGQVYSQDELEGLARILSAQSEKNGRPVYLVADEPYRFLTFGGVEVPPVLPLYKYAILVSSFSKSLSLAGARVGYVAVSPAMEDAPQLMAGLILANRILGFVNAPAIAQRILIKALDARVEASVYEKRRNLMADILDEAGLEYTMPKGAFYFFPKAPEQWSDVDFVDRLMQERVLAVPGSGFGCPGYFRLAFCVSEEVIANSRPGFVKAVKG